MFGLKRKKSPLLEAAEALHAWAVKASREPRLYSDLGAPDTIDGRFELLTAHVLLLVDRLKSDVPAMGALRQELFDVYISHLDGAMREMGVSDLAMGKRMRKLGQAIYGRAKAYDDAFALLPDPSTLEAVLNRTILGGQQEVSGVELAKHMLARRDALRLCSDASLLAGDPRPGASA